MERNRGKSSNAKSKAGMNKRVHDHDIDRGSVGRPDLDTDSGKDSSDTDILNRGQERVGNSPNVTGEGETSHHGGMLDFDFNQTSDVERSP